MHRENLVRAVELAIRMNTDTCPHYTVSKRAQQDCTQCLAEISVTALEERVSVPWTMSSSD